jgi:hypothetical protein
MQSINRKHAFDAPAAVFQHPLRVVSNADLSHDEKIVVLRNWKHELEQLQESNSTRSDGFDRLEVESRLAAVTDALSSLHTRH